MVTISEAKTQISKGLETLKTQTSKVRSVFFKPPTRKETLGVAARFREIQTARQAQGQQVLTQIASARQTLLSQQAEVERIEKENERIRKAREALGAQQLRFRQVVKFARTGKPAPPGAFTKTEQKLVAEIREGRVSQAKFVAQQKELDTERAELQEKLKMSIAPAIRVALKPEVIVRRKGPGFEEARLVPGGIEVELRGVDIPFRVVAEPGAVAVGKAPLFTPLPPETPPPITPTRTERALLISLPADIRTKTIEEIEDIIPSVKPITRPTPITKPALFGVFKELVDFDIPVKKIFRFGTRGIQVVAGGIGFFQRRAPITLLEERVGFREARELAGREATEFIERGRVGFREFLLPSERKERLKRGQEDIRFQSASQDLQTDILAFETKFGERELSEKEFQQAQKEREELLKDIGEVQELQTDIEEARAKRGEEREFAKPFFTTVTQRALTGAALVPFDLAKLSIQALTKPEIIPTALVAGAIASPSALKERPITGTAEIAGALAVQEAALVGLAGGRFGRGIKAQKAQLDILTEKGLITPTTAKALLEAIRLQRFLKGSPDVPVTGPVISIIPSGLTKAEQAVFARTLLAEDPIIFGGKALEIRGIRTAKDIDLFIKDSRRVVKETETLLREVSEKKIAAGRESVGLGETKAFDIKPLSRRKEFLLTEPPIATAEGTRVITASEQFSRALSGTLGLRKGGKDFGDVVLAGRKIVEQSLKEQTQIPILKQFQQFKIAKAERRLVKVEKALPDIEFLVEKAGVAELVPIPIRRGFISEFPQILDAFPAGKKAALEFSSKRTNIIKKVDDLVKDAFGPPTKRPKVKRRVKDISDLTPSDVAAVTLRPSRIGRAPTVSSIFRAPSLAASDLVAPLAPSILPRAIESVFAEPTPSEIISPVAPSIISPPSLIKPPRAPPSFIPGIPEIRLPGFPRPKPPRKPPIIPRLRGKPVKRISKPKSFNVFGKPVKLKGQKQKPPIKLNTKGLSRKDALNLGASLIDKSLARTFEVRPARGKPSKPQLGVPRSFFSQNRNKFRNFRVRRGKKILIDENRFIEKGKFLLDTKGERRKITLAKRLSELRGKKRKKPRTKKKTRTNTLNFLR